LHKVRQEGIAAAALEKLGCSINYAGGDSSTMLEQIDYGLAKINTAMWSD